MVFEVVKGNVVIIMDVDLQDFLDEILEFYCMIIQDDFDVVFGWKQKWYDLLLKMFFIKLYNWVVCCMIGIYLYDFNCGLKVYKLVVVKSIELYGDMYCYIFVLVKFVGFNNIGEKVVIYQVCKYGVFKFGLNCFLNGLLDLMIVVFMGKFGKKFMYFFGVIGMFFFIIGFGFVLYLGIDKFFFEMNGRLIIIWLEFYILLVVMIIGL